MIKRVHQRPVYMVAFDHRRSLRRALSVIGTDDPIVGVASADWRSSAISADRNGADGPGCYVRLYHSRAVPSNSWLRSWSLSPVVIASAASVTPW